MHYQQYRLDQIIKEWKTKLDKEISQNYTRNRDHSQHSAANLEHCQTSRGHQHSIGRDWNNNFKASNNYKTQNAGDIFSISQDLQNII